MKRLLDYCSVSGKNVPQFDGIKKYVATGDVINNRITSYENVDYKNKPSRANQIADSNEVLFAKMKDTKKVLLINEKTAKNIYSTGFFVIKANLNVLPEYLYWLFNSKKFNQDKDKNSKGATQKAINLEGLGKIMIKEIPSLDKQKKIISKINRCNEIIELKKEQLDELEKLIKSQFVEMFEKRNYPLVKLGDEFNISSGGTPSKTNKDYWNSNDVSWIGSNMCQNVILYENDGKFISNLGLEKSSAKVYPIDTVLIALVGATIGKTALLKFKTATNQNIAGIIVNKNFSAEYVFYALQSLYYKFIELGDGAFKMANLSFIRDLEIPKPDIKKQNQFASFVEHINKLEFVKIMKRDSATRLEYVEKFV